MKSRPRGRFEVRLEAVGYLRERCGIVGATSNRKFDTAEEATAFGERTCKNDQTWLTFRVVALPEELDNAGTTE